MSDSDAQPVDPMDDPAEHGEAPKDSDAIEAAERMNDADEPQPGVAAHPAEPSDEDPLPEIPG